MKTVLHAAHLPLAYRDWKCDGVQAASALFAEGQARQPMEGFDKNDRERPSNP